MIAFRCGGLRERDRKELRRKLDEIGDIAGERLQNLVDHEFRALPDNERIAALDAVVDALNDADLSDSALLRSNVDPGKLSKEIRGNIPSAKCRADLGEAAGALFDLALDQVCIQLVHLVRELPEFEGRLAEESLRRASEVLASVDHILDRLPTTSLDAPAGTDHDDQFHRRYLDLVARHYDDLELIGVSVRNFRPRTTLSVAYLSLTVNQTAVNRHGNDRVADDHWFGNRSYVDSSTLRVEAALRRPSVLACAHLLTYGREIHLPSLVSEYARPKPEPAPVTAKPRCSKRSLQCTGSAAHSPEAAGSVRDKPRFDAHEAAS